MIRDPNCYHCKGSGIKAGPGEYTTDRCDCVMSARMAAFDGPDVTPEDVKRLTRQLDEVREALESITLTGERRWWSLEELAAVTSAPESSVSARCRDLRKARNGGYNIERRRRGPGQWEYRIAPRVAPFDEVPTARDTTRERIAFLVAQVAELEAQLDRARSHAMFGACADCGKERGLGQAGGINGLRMKLVCWECFRK